MMSIPVANISLSFLGIFIIYCFFKVTHIGDFLFKDKAENRLPVYFRFFYMINIIND